MKTSQTKVFLLDDDTSFLEETRHVLEEGGFDVATCNKPLESLRAIQNYKPDCLLLDVRMPLVQGDTLVMWIDQWFPQLPTVICTGTTDYDKEILRRYKITQVLEKPFSGGVLFKTIESAILEKKNKPPTD